MSKSPGLTCEDGGGPRRARADQRQGAGHSTRRSRCSPAADLPRTATCCAIRAGDRRGAAHRLSAQRRRRHRLGTAARGGDLVPRQLPGPRPRHGRSQGPARTRPDHAGRDHGRPERPPLRARGHRSVGACRACACGARRHCRRVLRSARPRGGAQHGRLSRQRRPRGCADRADARASLPRNSSCRPTHCSRPSTPPTAPPRAKSPTRSSRKALRAGRCRRHSGACASPARWRTRKAGCWSIDKAQVIRPDGSVIAGLLAAGGTVTGISGHGAAGYSSGNGLAQAFALGMIAAETIAAEHGEATMTSIAAIGSGAVRRVSSRLPALRRRIFPTGRSASSLPYAAGGTGDIIVRLLGPKLSSIWGQQLMVDNRPGAGGVIGTEFAARSEPDGYTLYLATDGPLTVAASLHKNLSYNWKRDFMPVTMLAVSYQVMLVKASDPARNLQEFIAQRAAAAGRSSTMPRSGSAARRISPPKWSSPPPTWIWCMCRIAGSSAQAMTAMIAGDVAMFMNGTASSIPHIQSGALRGSRSPARIASPICRTFRPSPKPDCRVSMSFSGSPPSCRPARRRPIVKKLHADLVQAVSDPEFKKALEARGLEVKTMTPRGAGRLHGARRRQVPRSDPEAWAQGGVSAGSHRSWTSSYEAKNPPRVRRVLDASGGPLASARILGRSNLS